MDQNKQLISRSNEPTKNLKRKRIILISLAIILPSVALFVFIMGFYTIGIGDWIYTHFITGLGLLLPAIIVSIYFLYLNKQLKLMGSINKYQIGFFFSSLVSIGMLIPGIIFAINDDLWYIILSIFLIFGISTLLCILFGLLYFRSIKK